VLSAAEAVERYGQTACFVVTIYQGLLGSSPAYISWLSTGGAFCALLWKHADIFIPQCCLELPHRLVEQSDRIRQCYAMLAMNRRGANCANSCSGGIALDFSALSPPLNANETYFPMDLLSPVPEEVFVDCGSFDGESIRASIVTGAARSAMCSLSSPIH